MFHIVYYPDILLCASHEVVRICFKDLYHYRNHLHSIVVKESFPIVASSLLLYGKAIYNIFCLFNLQYSFAIKCTPQSSDLSLAMLCEALPYHPVARVVPFVEIRQTSTNKILHSTFVTISSQLNFYWFEHGSFQSFKEFRTIVIHNVNERSFQFELLNLNCRLSPSHYGLLIAI